MQRGVGERRCLDGVGATASTGPRSDQRGGSGLSHGQGAGRGSSRRHDRFSSTLAVQQVSQVLASSSIFGGIRSWLLRRGCVGIPHAGHDRVCLFFIQRTHRSAGGRLGTVHDRGLRSTGTGSQRDDSPALLGKKTYRLSKSHGQFLRAIGSTGCHEVMMTSPLGLVPKDLEDVWPAANYDVPVTGDWSSDELGSPSNAHGVGPAGRIQGNHQSHGHGFVVPLR